MKERIKNWFRKYKFCFIWKRGYTPFVTTDEYFMKWFWSSRKLTHKAYSFIDLNNWWPDMNWGNWSTSDQAVQLPENIEQIPGGGVKLIARRQNCEGYVWKTAPDGSHYKVYKGGFKFSTGCLKSKETYGFGRFLWQCQMPSFIGAWTALWLYEGDDDGYREIDFEMFGKNKCGLTQISPGVYKGKDHPTANHYSTRLQCIKPSKRFYWYEMDWQPDYLALYINGRLVFYTTENVPQHEQFVIMSMGIGYYDKMKDWDDFKIGEVVGKMIIKQFIYIK